jgi:hypothetical protein
MTGLESEFYSIVPYTWASLWPPRSPDLSTCDIYLWGYLKGKVYETNPHALDELKENIRSAIEAVDVIVLCQVYLNISRA